MTGPVRLLAATVPARFFWLHLELGDEDSLLPGPVQLDVLTEVLKVSRSL